MIAEVDGIDGVSVNGLAVDLRARRTLRPLDDTRMSLRRDRKVHRLIGRQSEEGSKRGEHIDDHSHAVSNLTTVLLKNGLRHPDTTALRAHRRLVIRKHSAVQRRRRALWTRTCQDGRCRELYTESRTYGPSLKD
jgi:hypothetical protein